MLVGVKPERDDHVLYEDLAVRHVMGGLDEHQAGVFRSHLLDCAHCRARVGELRAIASELAEVERAERRERATRTVDTKQRAEEEEDQSADRSVRSRRTLSRVVALGLAVLAFAVTAWAFALRAANEQLQDALQTEVVASSVVNFGTPWEVERVADGLDAVARSADGRLVVLLDGVEGGGPYEIRQIGSSGEHLQRDSATASDDLLRAMVPVADGTQLVEVVEPASHSRPETILMQATPSGDG